ncbi:MAG: rhomboid family intramembrane serine protease [Planctomycetes bacterium]|nr:rhomboid family intramembrane serine protease [Planctomycetota bacterium]
MGLYDRDYATVRDPSRREDGGFRALFGHHSTLTVLIAVNIAVFILWQIPSLKDVMETHFVCRSDGVLNHWRLHTLLTAAISHQEIFHLLMNMVVLYWLGKKLEVVYGSLDFLLLYCIAGAISSAGDIGMKLAFSELLAQYAGALGASGAVMGIAVCTAFLYPDEELMLFGLAPIKLKWLVVIYCVWDLHKIFVGPADGIGHAAHLGGAFAGFLYSKYDLRMFPVDGGPRFTPLRALRNLFRRKPRLRVVEQVTPGNVVEEPLSRSASARLGRVDADTAERVDRLLKKISEQGMGALTPEERRFLESSSEKYKR